MAYFENFQFVLTVWSVCEEPYFGRKGESKHFLNICYLPNLLQMLFYVILKTTLWSKNCTTLPFCCCFKQGRDLKHQRGTDTCPKSHSLLVILNPDCLTEKPLFFLLGNVAAIKLHLIHGRTVEFSHSLHSIFKLLMSSSLPLSLCFFFLPAISLFIPWGILTQS